MSPSSQSIEQGDSGTYTVNVSRRGGFTAAVDLSVSGLRSGISGGFNRDPIGSGQTSSTLTITVAPSAALGSDVFTVTGTGGGEEESDTATVVVVEPPGFTLSVTPSSKSIEQGASGTYTVTVSRRGGFASAVDLSVSGFPTGISGSFSPDPVPSTETSSTLTLTVAAAAAVGSTDFTVSGTGGGLAATDTAMATVVVSSSDPNSPPDGDFTLSISPLSGEVEQGLSRTYEVTLNPGTGFTDSVELSVSGLGTNVTGSFAPASVSATETASTLTVEVERSVVTGSQPFTVSGTAGTLTRTATATLVIQEPPTPSKEYVYLGGGPLVIRQSAAVTSSTPPAQSSARPVRLTSFSVSPGRVEVGECYLVRVGGGADVTLDVRYRYQEELLQTMTPWIRLDERGEYRFCPDHRTRLGRYLFLSYRKAGSGKWIQMEEAIEVVQARQPGGFSFSRQRVGMGECVVARVQGGAGMTIDAQYRRDGGPLQTVTAWIRLDERGERRLCVTEESQQGSMVFEAYRNHYAQQWIRIDERIQVGETR